MEQAKRAAAEQAEAQRRAQFLCEVTGVNGQVSLKADRIIIRRSGLMAFLSQGLKGDKEILVSQVSSIQFRKPDLLTNGYIQFGFLGGREAKGGLFQATSDENTVMFSSAQLADFERLKALVEQQMQASRQVPKPASSLDDLERLASLRDKGIITEEEFAAKKKQILGLG